MYRKKIIVQFWNVNKRKKANVYSFLNPILL